MKIAINKYLAFLFTWNPFHTMTVSPMCKPIAKSLSTIAMTKLSKLIVESTGVKIIKASTNPCPSPKSTGSRMFVLVGFNKKYLNIN